MISTIIEDKTGIIWIGTNSGVNKYNGELFTHLTQNEGLISDNIYNIIEDKKGNLWFGSANGVCNYNHSSFTYFSKKMA
ncbi:MAG: hypothetical protein IPM77_15165 [Crocinitomicaceae bacterium]|nr:hypothetical protein [Crocinitomicaceae bacterium]